MKKRILASILVLSMLASLVACGGNTTNPGDNTTPGAETTAPVTTAPEATTPEETTAEPVVDVPDLGYEHVIILGVDGAGAFFKDADTPRMDEIFVNGATTFNAITASPTISAQCWGAMLLGVTPDIHNMTNDSIENKKRFSHDDMPSIFRLVREAKPDAKLGAFCNWDPILNGIIENDVGVTEDSGGDGTVAKDVINFFKENLPTLIFAQFDSVDGAGHSYGYGSQSHLDQINYIDKQIGKVYDAIVEAGVLDTTLLIVTADHGGHDTGHGGETPEEKTVFMGVVGGKSVIAGSEIIDAETRDVAAIALTALGVPLHSNMSSRVPSGMFEGITAPETRNVSKPLVPMSAYRKHDTVPTPDVSKLQEMVGDHEILAYLPFDGDASVKLGSASSEAHGKLYYTDSYFGQGASFDDGYVSLSNLSLGADSFTFACWLKLNNISGSPVIFGNRDMSSNQNPGVVLGTSEDGHIFFKVCGNGSETSAYTKYDETALNAWMHLTLTVDRESRQATIYLDYSESGKTIVAQLKDMSLDLTDVINIAQDVTGAYESHLSATLDEVLVLKGAMSEDDFNSFRSYYGLSEIVLVEAEG